MKSETTVKTSVFLKDVFLCSLSAFGGPQSHMGVFLDQLVRKKRYLSEEELIELIALCSVLPGPTSTQTIVSTGYKKGGPLLAFFTFLVWALPIMIVMGTLSFAFVLTEGLAAAQAALTYIGPMAVGFILVAAVRIGRKVIKDRFTGILLILSALLSYLFRFPWVFPLILLAGGTAEILRQKGKEGNPPLWKRVAIKPRWGYFSVFAAFALLSLLLDLLSSHPLAVIFDSFYRYGYLVFGGGQVVIPMMHNELVEIHGFMSSREFLAGYGLVQGLPGPMFSFATYAGGMAYRGAGFLNQLLGAVIGGVHIFLPGILLIYFVYPLWEDVKQIPGIKIAITGINAAAGGMLVSAAPVVFLASGISWVNGAVTLASALILGFTKLPAPVLVLLTLGAGLIGGLWL